MGLNIPPDVNPMPNGLPPGHREHEFDIMQNDTISGLAGWMAFVSIMTMIMGGLYSVNGLLHFASVSGMITIAVGVCMVMMGIWLWGASRSFKMIVTTEGMDITLLMDALKKLRGVYTMQGIFLIISVVLFVIVIFLFVGATSGRNMH
ncbi:MAG: hypothetical protein H0V17_06205 [Deltaproteobacteria bacterium]|nr:hypothetical protein [Deltaproteobacteria bacterium]